MDGPQQDDQRRIVPLVAPHSRRRVQAHPRHVHRRQSNRRHWCFYPVHGVWRSRPSAATQTPRPPHKSHHRVGCVSHWPRTIIGYLAAPEHIVVAQQSHRTLGKSLCCAQSATLAAGDAARQSGDNGHAQFFVNCRGDKKICLGFLRTFIQRCFLQCKKCTRSRPSRAPSNKGFQWFASSAAETPLPSSRKLPVRC